MFRTNASQFYKELNGRDKEENISPDPSEATKFWSDIWSVPSTHNHDARWLQKVKQELADVKGIMITVESIRKCVSGMLNWKVPGPDCVQGFWFKRMANLHDRLVKHLQACLNTGIVPSWMTKGRTVLIMKDCKKGGVTGNYRPIACLLIMWKLLTGINGDEITVT